MNFNEKSFSIKEIEKVLTKAAIRESIYEEGEFISPFWFFLVDSKFKEAERICALRAFWIGGNKFNFDYGNPWLLYCMVKVDTKSFWESY